MIKKRLYEALLADYNIQIKYMASRSRRVHTQVSKKILKRITEGPWFLRNTQPRRDLKINITKEQIIK